MYMSVSGNGMRLGAVASDFPGFASHNAPLDLPLLGFRRAASLPDWEFMREIASTRWLSWG